MKGYKFEAQIKNDNGEIKNKQYKSIKEISDDLGIDYHNIRHIIIHQQNPKKFLHNHMKELNERVKITPIKKTINLNIE